MTWKKLRLGSCLAAMIALLVAGAVGAIKLSFAPHSSTLESGQSVQVQVTNAPGGITLASDLDLQFTQASFARLTPQWSGFQGPMENPGYFNSAWAAPEVPRNPYEKRTIDPVTRLGQAYRDSDWLRDQPPNIPW
jgi:hypothetical protein